MGAAGLLLGKSPQKDSHRPLAERGFRAIFWAVFRISVSPVPEMIQNPVSIAPFMAARKDGDENGTGLGLATRTRTRTKKPTPYKVLMLNDDYTPMEFVVLCLQRFFRMNIEDATRVMLHVHQKGVGVCGVFSYEVAETKVSQVVDFARQNQHPLQCTLEKA
jgi:ATP-dependent Clp protease adaptor protein ClpS